MRKLLLIVLPLFLPGATAAAVPASDAPRAQDADIAGLPAEEALRWMLEHPHGPFYGPDANTLRARLAREPERFVDLLRARYASARLDELSQRQQGEFARACIVLEALHNPAAEALLADWIRHAIEAERSLRSGGEAADPEKVAALRYRRDAALGRLKMRNNSLLGFLLSGFGELGSTGQLHALEYMQRCCAEDALLADSLARIRSEGDLSEGVRLRIDGTIRHIERDIDPGRGP